MYLTFLIFFFANRSQVKSNGNEDKSKQTLQVNGSIFVTNILIITIIFPNKMLKQKRYFDRHQQISN